MKPVARSISNIKAGVTSLGWWRDRVFVPFVLGTLTRFHPSYPGYGEAVNVMWQDWDNLVVFDACRADVFETVVGPDRFDHYSRAVSLGSHSSEWTSRNFRGRTFADTVYVSANPHTSLLPNDTFYALIEVWKDHDVSPNRIDPAAIVAAARDAHERYPDKRLIVHFMQPHGPGRLRDRDLPHEEWYRRSLEDVAGEALELLESIGGRSVVTADHGELFSSGLKAALGVDQHKARLRFPALVYVPWAVLDGDRRRTASGRTDGTDTDRESIKERLRDLGYH